MIIIVIDSILLRFYFILTYIIFIVENATRLFLHHVWKLHSLSIYIVLNKGLQFIVLFTKKLYIIT